MNSGKQYNGKESNITNKKDSKNGAQQKGMSVVKDSRGGKKNSSSLPPPPPPPPTLAAAAVAAYWQCPVCTYIHANQEAAFLACKTCGTERVGTGM